MLDTDTPNSPGWWLVRLTKRLIARRPDIAHLQRLYDGDHDLAEASDEDSRKFREFQKLSRSNYLSLVVEAPLERLRVQGFRAGPEDKTGDEASWAIWNGSQLNANQVLAHRTALTLRRSFVIVGPHPRKHGKLLITPEHPAHVITEAYPDSPREARAALKLITDPITGLAEAWLYLPEVVMHFRSREKAPDFGLLSNFYNPGEIAKWTFVEQKVNPTYPEVPVVEFACRPGLLGRASCEFESAIDNQNRLNQSLLHRLVAEKFASWRQLAILNLDFEEDENGDPIAPELPSNPGVAWLLQGDNLQVFQSAQTSTSDIMKGIEADIRDIAAITRTPPHYLLNSIVNASGDALKSAETGLVAKVREHAVQFGESWELVMHLAHLLNGSNREAADLEVMWADPESRSLAALSDAANKQLTAGVPWNARMELLGYTPTEIQRMEADRVSDALVASMTQAPANTAPVAA